MPFVSLACCFLVPYIVTTVADDHRSTAPKNVFHARQLLHWEQSSTVEVIEPKFSKRAKGRVPVRQPLRAMRMTEGKLGLKSCH
mmetsp:Transcript_73907/g.149474  ORF Transcript_73907/g.149474 Transcript_73907/m.149474 type:complete len:84 (-) Transcript_73907:55-306(-)